MDGTASPIAVVPTPAIGRHAAGTSRHVAYPANETGQIWLALSSPSPGIEIDMDDGLAVVLQQALELVEITRHRVKVAVEL